MSAHIVDRFFDALYPAGWSDSDEPPPDGEFHTSPEIVRMLIEHARRAGWSNQNGRMMFGLPVVVDPTMPRGDVIFLPAAPR